MNIEIIKKYLEDSGTERNGGSTRYIDTSFETMPNEFMFYAERDLETNFEHKYINALSNTKRALDCQADRLLKLFGFYKLSQEKYWGFPKKLEVIQRFDLVTPRVLTKINKARNLMEHQYLKPNATQVEDFWDIVSLFLTGTEHYASKSLPSVNYTNYESDEFPMIGELELEVDNENGKMIINTDSQYRSKTNVKVELFSDNPEYIEVFKRHLKKIDFR
jgi:hypothetical protein